MIDLIYSFVIGIASGIISSLIVTAIYRKIDQEKERQRYFSDIRRYIANLLNIDTSDLVALDNYTICNEFPVLQKWIHLKKDETIIINKLQNKINYLSTIMLDYKTGKISLLKHDKTEEEINDILSCKYTPELIKLTKDISQMVNDIFNLRK